MITVKLLNNEEFRGKKLDFHYNSCGYYDLQKDGFSFAFTVKKFDEPRRLGFDDELLEEWWNEPVLYGAYDGDKLAGVVELSKEEWNNRLRVTNIWVEEGYRRSGVGSALMNTAKRHAQSINARMIVLETQSCNLPAISFYLKHGFEPIGLDAYSYSNHDAERHEVRIEMGYIIS